jgi:hypothetical protein
MPENRKAQPAKVLFVRIMDSALAEAIDAFCDRRHLTYVALCELAIRQYIANHPEGDE